MAMARNTTVQTRSRNGKAAARRLRWRALLVLVATAALVLMLPLAGPALAGRPVADYLHFPPLTHPVAHAPFSWAVFVAIALPSAAALGLLGWVMQASGRHPLVGTDGGALRWWGWLGIALVTAGWILAWTEGLLPSELRRHTFTVIWLGCILTLNAATLRRGGECPLVHRSRWFFALFPVSAGFWWLFEYLNQFTGNWYYIGIGDPSQGAYIVQGTLAFATVLPAVVSARAWLSTYFKARALPALAVPRLTAWLALAAGAAALAGIGVFPEALFPVVWIAPVLLVGSLQFLLLGASSLAPLARGDWRALIEPAAAALVCGLLWELWNYGSLAKWQYSIPYVQRFHLFEMPLAGYAGYLPFGVLCALVSDVVARLAHRAEPAGT
jgi:hypothetical protein